MEFCFIYKPSYGIIFEAFTVVTINNDVLLDVKPSGSSKNRRFRGMYCLHHQGKKNQRARGVSSN
jgi:hypothetical protein